MGDIVVNDHAGLWRWWEGRHSLCDPDDGEGWSTYFIEVKCRQCGAEGRYKSGTGRFDLKDHCVYCDHMKEKR